MRRISRLPDPSPAREREGPAAAGGGRVRARPLRQVNATEALARVRTMRWEPTEAEALLWRHLRDRRLAGAKFKQQMWIGAYIADFACIDARLIVEADGGQHGEQIGYDIARDTALAAAGWRVMRFWNADIAANVTGILDAIREALHAPSPSHAAHGPLPLPPGEGK